MPSETYALPGQCVQKLSVGWGMDWQLHKTRLSYPKQALKLHTEGLLEEGLCVAKCGAKA